MNEIQFTAVGTKSGAACGSEDTEATAPVQKFAYDIPQPVLKAFLFSFLRITLRVGWGKRNGNVKSMGESRQVLLEVGANFINLRDMMG